VFVYAHTCKPYLHWFFKSFQHKILASPRHAAALPAVKCNGQHKNKSWFTTPLLEALAVTATDEGGGVGYLI
jgi:hypothetical protein